MHISHPSPFRKTLGIPRVRPDVRGKSLSKTSAGTIRCCSVVTTRVVIAEDEKNSRENACSRNLGFRPSKGETGFRIVRSDQSGKSSINVVRLSWRSVRLQFASFAGGNESGN